MTPLEKRLARNAKTRPDTVTDEYTYPPHYPRTPTKPDIFFAPLFEFLTSHGYLDSAALIEAHAYPITKQEGDYDVHMFKFSLHGLHATGASKSEAFRNWRSMAFAIRNWKRSAESTS